MPTLLNLAYEILKEAEEPLVPLEIWRQIEEKGLRDSLGTTGKTPWRTLGARLYVAVIDNSQSRFVNPGGAS